MIRKYVTRTVLSLFLLDQSVLVASIAAALWLKMHLILRDPVLPWQAHVHLFVWLWPFLAVTLAFSGAYDLNLAVGGLRPLLRRTLVAALAMAGVWIAGTFYFKMSVLFSYSRGVFTLFLFFSAVGLALVRVLYARFANASWRKSGHPRRVLVFGGESAGREITHHLRHQVFIPVGVIEATGEVDLPGVLRVSEEEALAGIRQGEVDQIIVDLPPKRLRLLLRVAKAAEREGIPLQMTPAIFAGMHLRPRSDRIGSMPVIELCGGELPFSGVIAKRAFDLVASTMGIVFLSPVLLVIALLVKLTSPGPVLFRQKRVGLDGRRFHMLKFRTMVANAEDATGPVFAVTDDPRCTRVGRILRRTNLDELPQLFNIFMGTMSLVGPRPERPVFVEEFKPVIERYSHKHWVKPGVTGWAQVNGWRGRTDIQRRIDHDMEYVERWSFWFDLKILYLTVVHAFRGALPGH